MCGLTGFLSSFAQLGEDAQASISKMTNALRHRGPDAEGTWIGEGIALGHRRLSILDLTVAGAQPMFSDSGRYVLVFNGEIYNHLDLRNTLEKADAAPTWHGFSDTETLLAAIEHWGLDEALQRAHGMFALAIWDTSERCLQLARDRLGEKPLYWGWVGQDLVFGSELKALKKHHNFSLVICKDALSQYLCFSYIPAPRSIYQGIYKLEPGCILDVTHAPPSQPPEHPLRPGDRHGSLSIRRYWHLNEALELGRQQLFTNEKEALSVLGATLEAAVDQQMQADVHLGAFLSGGIDSSLIVALMQRQAQQPVRTFTVGFESAAFNEAPHAATVARHLGTNHTEVMVTQAEARDVIPLLPQIYDEPFADSSQIPTYLVCKTARAGIAVALSGDGGDELFGGYNRYFWGPRIWRFLNFIPQSIRPVIASGIAAVPIVTWDSVGGLFTKLGAPAVSRPGDKAHKLAARLSNSRTVDEFYRSLVSEWAGTSQPIAFSRRDVPSALDDPLPSAFNDNISARMMVQDMRTYLPDDILCKVDRAAMAVGLESRVPFLDADVILASARLPHHMKIRDGQGKWALRQILYQHVPKHLIDRPKTGFSMPVGAWLRGPLRAWAEGLLTPAQLALDDLLDPEPIRAVWAEHLSGKRDWSSRLWIILMFQAWRAEQ